jgi:hypothetical protein
MKVDSSILTLLSSATILSCLDLVFGSEEELSAEQCKALGFTKNNVLCSSCADLPQYDLQILKDNCDRCCRVDVSSEEGVGEQKSVKRYPKARLEVCG